MSNKSFKITIFFLLYAVLALLLVAKPSLANNLPKNIDMIRKTIVSIDSSISVAAYGGTGNWSGSGFIVDKKAGYLVTNNHVVGPVSIGSYFVTFYNGQQAKAKLVYHDDYNDFAILKVDPDKLPKETEEVKFSQKAVNRGDDVFIVGNTESQGFSFHNGYISDLYNINGELPQHSYIVNVNSAGGASGSPVLNRDNEAIGILYGGSKTYAIILKSSYITHGLEAIKQKKLPARQHIGVITNTYSLSKAVMHRHFDQKMADDYVKEFPQFENKVIIVKNTLPNSTAAGKLQAGDILWQINGKKIGANLSLFDQEMNLSQDFVKIEIIRNGQKIAYDVKLYDLNQHKITKILDFAGALFFETNDAFAAQTGLPLGSVALSNVQTGSSFSAIPQHFTENRQSVYRLLIKSINGQAINKLDDVITAMKGAISAQYINIEYDNFLPYYPEYNANNGFISAHNHYMCDITFSSIDTKPRILRYDPEQMEWVSEIIKLD